MRGGAGELRGSRADYDPGRLVHAQVSSPPHSFVFWGQGHKCPRSHVG